MNKLLFSVAAAAILASAAPALAGDDTTNNQLNRGIQISLNGISNLSARDANISAQAVGNAITVETHVAASGSSGSGYALAGTHFASVQVNQGSLQVAGTSVSNVGISGDVEVSAQSIGNTGSFSADNGPLGSKVWQGALAVDMLNGMGQYGAAQAFAGYNAKAGLAFQLNDSSVQLASVDVRNSGFGAELDSSSTAVGNNLDFAADNGNASAVGFQVNTNSLQLATTNVSNVGVNWDATINTSAIGNIASWSSANYGAADGINFQSNLGSAQLSLSNVSNAGFNSSLTVGTIAAGNVANIGVRP